MKIQVLTLTFLFVISCTTSEKKPPNEAEVAPNTTSSEPTTPHLKVTMYQVADLVLKLQNFATSSEKFSSDENHPKVQSILDDLSKKSTAILKHSEIKTTAYRLSGEALDRHFQDLKEVYRNGNPMYARWMAAATPMACASCHTQLPNSPPPLFNLTKDEIAGSPSDRAEILFATRNYDVALNLYDNIIRGHERPTTDFKQEVQLEKALNRKLVILLRIKRDINLAQASFGEDLKNTALPKYLKIRIASWIKKLPELQKKFGHLENANSKTILRHIGKEYARGRLNEDNVTEQIYVSGLLYEILHQHSQDSYTPQLLYVLSLVDTDLNKDFFFGLSQSYLRECINRFPKHPIARSCYKEYALEERAMWSGSGGYRPPVKLEEELNNLKSKLEQPSSRVPKRN